MRDHRLLHRTAAAGGTRQVCLAAMHTVAHRSGGRARTQRTPAMHSSRGGPLLGAGQQHPAQAALETAATNAAEGNCCQGSCVALPAAFVITRAAILPHAQPRLGSLLLTAPCVTTRRARCNRHPAFQEAFKRHPRATGALAPVCRKAHPPATETSRPPPARKHTRLQLRPVFQTHQNNRARNGTFASVCKSTHACNRPPPLLGALKPLPGRSFESLARDSQKPAPARAALRPSETQGRPLPRSPSQRHPPSCTPWAARPCNRTGRARQARAEQSRQPAGGGCAWVAGGGSPSVAAAAVRSSAAPRRAGKRARGGGGGGGQGGGEASSSRGSAMP